jgi:hypothetical protein
MIALASRLLQLAGGALALVGTLHSPRRNRAMCPIFNRSPAAGSIRSPENSRRYKARPFRSGTIQPILMCPTGGAFSRPIV